MATGELSLVSDLIADWMLSLCLRKRLMLFEGKAKASIAASNQSILSLANLAWMFLATSTM
jgi:hypothetical protein